MLASGSSDKTTILYETKSGGAVLKLEGHSGPVGRFKNLK